MKITLENIGPFAGAEFEPGGYTAVYSRKNTDNTWVYLLHGFLAFRRGKFIPKINYRAILQLKNRFILYCPNAQKRPTTPTRKPPPVLGNIISQVNIRTMPEKVTMNSLINEIN